MAPHWKCGLGQPIAGSNPALSATLCPAARIGDVTAGAVAELAIARHVFIAWASRPLRAWRRP